MVSCRIGGELKSYPSFKPFIKTSSHLESYLCFFKFFHIPKACQNSTKTSVCTIHPFQFQRSRLRKYNAGTSTTKYISPDTVAGVMMSKAWNYP
jgi:hypothetical protein